MKNYEVRINDSLVMIYSEKLIDSEIYLLCYLIEMLDFEDKVTSSYALSFDELFGIIGLGNNDLTKIKVFFKNLLSKVVKFKSNLDMNETFLHFISSAKINESNKVVILDLHPKMKEFYLEMKKTLEIKVLLENTR